MNKKLLFGMMSLAALAACTDDDFQSLNVVTEETSPVQFEVINNNDAFTRAYMDGNSIQWSATDGDLFTLYHGGSISSDAMTKYQNATYTAVESDGAATLTTPSMILEGSAVMVWPVDTAFTNKGDATVAISIPEVLDNIENNITYASDVVKIAAYDGTKGADNSAGYSRKYPIYMRPLTSQLTIKADYAGTEATLAELYTGENAIDPIKVTSVALENTADKFTTAIALNFTDATTDDITRWGGAKRDNAWSHITGFATSATTQAAKLTTKVLTGNESAKFLILPESEADDNSAVVVNTIYGKVVIGKDTKYTTEENKDVWYRYLKATQTAETGETKATEETAGLGYKTPATDLKTGMSLTFTAIDGAKVSANTVVKGEPTGAAATRYVKVLLNHLDMSDLHITTDKQLRDAARVWQHIGAADVTVLLDGDDNKEFAISQETIAAINEINAAAAKEETPRKFTVKPCTVSGEKCSTIVITGGGDVPEDLLFIVKNGSTKANVALNADETWNWKGTVKVSGSYVNKIINRGTLVNAETATLKTINSAGKQTDVPLENAATGVWNITGGTLNVQINVTNYGIVNISEGAQYRQDGNNVTPTRTFVNEANTRPERFLAEDVDEEIGVVNNSGVFATVGGGVINNYGLIEHADDDAKTYITSNQSESAVFTTEFKSTNKMGRINLKYDNRQEDNVSISATAANGFVSVTVDGEVKVLSSGGTTTELGKYVNYIIVKSGITEIKKLNSQYKYVEINQPGTEIAWSTDAAASYTGLIVLSDVNIKYGTTVSATSTYLSKDATMYVGGTFNKDDTKWSAYYGDTEGNVKTNYVTFK